MSLSNSSYGEAEKILQIINPDSGSFTCVATALTRHRRCRRHNAHWKYSAIRKLLQRLPQLVEDPLELRQLLNQVGNLSICYIGAHQQQRSEIVGRWYNAIIAEEQKPSVRTSNTSSAGEDMIDEIRRLRRENAELRRRGDDARGNPSTRSIYVRHPSFVKAEFVLILISSRFMVRDTREDNKKQMNFVRKDLSAERGNASKLNERSFDGKKLDARADAKGNNRRRTFESAVRGKKLTTKRSAIESGKPKLAGSVGKKGLVKTKLEDKPGASESNRKPTLARGAIERKLNVGQKTCDSNEKAKAARDTGNSQ